MSSYDQPRAEWYEEHHRKNLRTRLTTWRERSLLSRALASIGPCASLLDVPCGGGRFFPVLLASRAPEILAADNSVAMLAVAAATQGVRSGRIRLLETSLFSLALGADAVDCIVCMRFMHHLALEADRRRVLAELHRVTRRWVVFSLWVDGNLQAWRRQPRPPVAGFGRRQWVPRERIEAELAASGFRVLRRFDVAPRWSMWRYYVLEKSHA